MDKLLVVDGSNLLFQMFYGMPARIVGKHGKPIHGTLGFVGALLKILKLTKPTHVVVLFDGECHNDRCDLNAEYKANRPDYSLMSEEETPFCQLPDVFAALNALGIPYAETTDCETDDWVAAYVRRYGGEMQVVISSFDSDFFQLITDMVSILRYRGEKTQVCDAPYLRAKLGIDPSQYADFKCLTGDAADNVTGVRGIGPKTASALLNEFGDLETLLLHVEEIAKPALRASIKESKERLCINKELIYLKGNVETPYPIERLIYRNLEKTTGQVLDEIGIR